MTRLQELMLKLLQLTVDRREMRKQMRFLRLEILTVNQEIKKLRESL